MNVDRLLYALYCNLKQGSALTRGLVKEGERIGIASTNATSDADAQGTLFLLRRKIAIGGSNNDIEHFDRNSVNMAIAERLVRHDRFSCEIRSSGIRIEFRADLHSEYWTLTAIVEITSRYSEGWNGPRLTRTSTADSSTLLGNLSQGFDDLYRVLQARSATTRRSDATNTKHDKMIDKARTLVIDEARTFIDNLISQHASPSLCAPNLVGGLIGDYYGVVMGAELDKTVGAKGRLKKLVMPRAGDDISHQLRADPIFEDEVPRQNAINAIWPIARRMSSAKAAETSLDKPDYTAVLFQGDRVAYLSSYAPTLRLADEDLGLNPHPAPVIFIVLSAHKSRWQLGRLIDRLCEIDTLRLAAVRDLAGISQVNLELRALQAEIHAGDYESATALQARYTSMVSGDPAGSHSRAARLDFIYRLDRAAYYIERYRNEISRLRSTRVEGFQTLDEYISRRLGDTFSFIGKLRERYADTGSLIESLVRLEQKERSDNRQKRIERLLENADKVIAIPLTYYITGILIYFLELVKSLVMAVGAAACSMQGHATEHCNKSTEALHKALVTLSGGYDGGIKKGVALIVGALLAIWIARSLERALHNVLGTQDRRAP